MPMKKNIITITLFLLTCSPHVLSDFLFIDPPATTTTGNTSTTTNTTSSPQANNDFASIVIGVNASITGNVFSNDLNSTGIISESSLIGQYGSLELQTLGEYTYTLFNNASTNGLTQGQQVTDVFQYAAFNALNEKSTAQLTIQITVNRPVIADNLTIRVNDEITSIEGNVNNETRNIQNIKLETLPSSDYGFLILNFDGSFTYTLYNNAPKVVELKFGDMAVDNFVYSYVDASSQTATATINVSIIGNPVDGSGNTVYEEFDHVDIEFNDRFAQATPLNSSRKIRGHLYNSEDKDWYTLPSAGNEVITVEVCPRGSSCFGDKNWVLYIFDSDLITKAMEERTFIFEQWLDATGSNADLSSATLIPGISGQSNHLYLAYKAGFFDGALIGVVDPCFDSSNTVDIGVSELPKNYLFAVSSPLKGDGNEEDDDGCGAGTVVLNKPARSIAGQNGATPSESQLYETTEEYINIFPFSDDQYVIKVTGTGIHPLLTEDAQAHSASYNSSTGEFIIPTVRVADELYQASLKLADPTLDNTNKNTLKFALDNLISLNPEDVTTTYQATYNPKSQQVIIPRVTVSSDGKPYSVILQYFPPIDEKTALLEVISFVLIQ